MTEQRLKHYGRTAWSLAAFVTGRYQRDNASSLAASLSYTSLLSLVPLVAIGLAMLAAFPVFNEVRGQIQAWAFANFVPAVGEVVQEQVERFVANAGRLSAVGIVGLAFSSIMLLVTIEGALNQVFRVAHARSPVSRLLVYWTVLTLGPLLLGATFSLQGYLTAVSRWAELGPSLGASRWLAAPLPTLFSILAFTVLYAAVPNRRVRLRDALSGGVAAGLLFAALRFGFALYVTSSQAYSTVYGAVATVPIFLFWMFLSWAVVLVGAEVTAALPEWRAGLGETGRSTPAALRLSLALDVLAQLQGAAMSVDGGGGAGLSRRDLLERTAVGERALLAVLRRLCEVGMVVALPGWRYLLARDLDAVSLWDLVEALDLGLGLDPRLGADDPWRARAGERIGAASAAARAALDTPLRPLLAAAAGVGDAAAPVAART